MASRAFRERPVLTFGCRRGRREPFTDTFVTRAGPLDHLSRRIGAVFTVRCRIRGALRLFSGEMYGQCNASADERHIQEPVHCCHLAVYLRLLYATAVP
jgi:hypothetical protein